MGWIGWGLLVFLMANYNIISLSVHMFCVIVKYWQSIWSSILLKSWFFKYVYLAHFFCFLQYLVSGPGCSSIGGGAFTEFGPFYPQGDGRGLRRNRMSWNRGTLSLTKPPSLEFSFFDFLMFGSKFWSLIHAVLSCLVFHSIEPLVCGVPCRSWMVILKYNLRLYLWRCFLR